MDMDYILSEDQLKIFSQAHDALHSDIMRKSEEAAKRKALEVIDEFREDLTRVSTAAGQINDIHNAIITGIDGAPGMLEIQRRSTEEAAALRADGAALRADIDALKANQIQWRPVLKTISLIAGVVGGLIGLLVVFAKAAEWLHKHWPLALAPLLLVL